MSAGSRTTTVAGREPTSSTPPTTPLELERELSAAWQRSDEIFALVDERDWLERPIGLRLPLLFYVGHLPAFAWNQLGRGALDAGALDAHLDVLFERGIDPQDEVSASASSAQRWPSVAETLAYRDRARAAVRARAAEVLQRQEDELCANGRVLQLAIEHELMHHETLLYMLAERAPTARRGAAAAKLPEPPAGDGRAAERRRIPAGPAVVGARWSELPFGWDNEFEQRVDALPAFELDSLPVRNRDWADFYRAHPAEENWPNAWLRGPTGWSVKTVAGPIALERAAGWPAQVSGEQAARYCRWRGGRLPTEPELARAAYATPDGGQRRYPWGAEPPSSRHANLGFRHWSPVPVGEAPDGASAFGVEELVGNGWEWTSTAFAPLPGFRAWARTYPGYSADFFDGAHDVVLGASWATDERLVRPSFRNWYRRSYPYPFTSFRVAHDL
ncbi:MAG: SUMF1/EgtB/PvdO family nonheme iron enzyme [Kofleriaceae bacterium]